VVVVIAGDEFVGVIEEGVRGGDVIGVVGCDIGDVGVDTVPAEVGLGEEGEEGWGFSNV
jgi:hypothetical protein